VKVTDNRFEVISVTFFHTHKNKNHLYRFNLNKMNRRK